MTTTPRPIAALDAELEQQTRDEPIASHLQLAVNLQSSDQFRSYSIQTPNDDVIVVNRDGLLQIGLEFFDREPYFAADHDRQQNMALDQ